jgi:phosphatidylserine decarboxylase
MSALTYATAQLLRALPREKITRLAGALADHKWSDPFGRTVVNIYRRAYNVELGECVEQGGWASFDAFFTRELREGARPIDSDRRAIVSPADGVIGSMERIEADATFRVKGSDYRVEDLVGDAREARRYVGGSGCVIYLSPRDYHRVHSPVAGVVATIRSIAGDYYPVNGIGLRHVKGLFVRNRRVAIAIDTPNEVGLGRVTVVMVAAIVVGRITATGIDARDVPFGTHTLSPAISVERGGEIGIFHLGSTAVVLLEPGAAGAWLVGDGPIKVGRAICRGAVG